MPRSSGLAAKVYRPRRFRQLRNDHLYREGRRRLDEDGNVILDGGMHHAMDKRTGYGRQLMHTSWIEHEVGGPMLAAPTLNTVDLANAEAGRVFERLLENVRLMLAHDLIHGDLSAYNILYWEGAATFIDFPQAISPRQNRKAYAIFRRDLKRLCEYFTARGLDLDSRGLAADLWADQGLDPMPDVHLGLLDDQDEADLEYWAKRKTRSG